MNALQDISFVLIPFILIAIASRQIGILFAKIHLPFITGLLAIGIIAGPYILNLIPTSTVHNLRFVEDVALAFIAFFAGAELCFSEIKERLKSIKYITIGLTFFTLVIGGTVFYLLISWIPTLNEMAPALKWSISVLAASIMVARSPASAVAIIKELRAEGPFTQTTLGVTVIVDVVVIILFSICLSTTGALYTSTSINFSFLLLLIVEFTISLLLALIVWKILEGVMYWSNERTTIKSIAILLVGYGVFVLSFYIHLILKKKYNINFRLEPLIICVLAGFFLANFTDFRDNFRRLLHGISEYVYVAFFTLTGASLVLNVLADIWSIVLIISLVRTLAIVLGSFVGGIISNDDMKYNYISWMVGITPAGLGLGLALNVGVVFPHWGKLFATIIISVIVINQLIGPLFFRWALFLAKEAYLPAIQSDRKEIHKAMIFGSDGQTLTLAQQLISHHWQVKVICKSSDDVKDIKAAGIDFEYADKLTHNSLQNIGAASQGAIITMLTDEDNLKICQLVREHFAEINLIVRLNSRDLYEQFYQLKTLIVSATTAMVSLLDHYVRSPSVVSLLLGRNEDMDIIDFRIQSTSLEGKSLAQLTILPNLYIISVQRNGKMLKIGRHVRLKWGDLITIAGPTGEVLLFQETFKHNGYS